MKLGGTAAVPSGSPGSCVGEGGKEGRKPFWRQNDCTLLQRTFSLKRLYNFNRE